MTTIDTEVTVTAALAVNLRALADLLDSVELPHAPYVTSNTVTGKVSANWYLNVHGEDLEGQKTAAASIIRAIGGHWDKVADVYKDFAFQQHRPGIEFFVQVTREAVCERVVTGTHTVTVPAVEARPETVETVEDVEWRCLPLLAEATSGGAA